ncbi:hypothetical protein EDD86DRAFT_190941 [Gorgonomyces haynaldii]|nr:hypothetical protein EDD86DRAFT_190941 [Gorgonomyces haynaldii]
MLRGKTVLVTGASAGIGKATALAFAQQGSHLILTARRTDRIEQLAHEIQQKYKVNVHPLTMDVRERKQVFDKLHHLPTGFKNVDVLVNNAGLVIGLDHLDQVSEHALDTMIDTNVKGLVHVTQAVLPAMKERRAGHIINISSIAGTQAYAGGSIYCATKHAVDAITKSLRFELVDTPLRVTSIDPGIYTEFSIVRYSGDKQKADAVYKGMDPLVAQDIAETIVFTANRPPHVQIASVQLFSTNQGNATTIYRK